MLSTFEQSEISDKVGNLYMAGMPGTVFDEHTEDLIRDYCLGGMILFSRNIEDPLQLATLCNDLQDCAMKYQGTPLFLAVDQEGGRVARLREPFTSFPGNSAIGADPEPEKRAEEFARVTADEMSLVGLNFDMAPVVDVRRGEPEKHLEGRTFGDDPEKVSFLGTIVAKTLQENGVMAAAKHFPGLGRASLDPHYHLLSINADAEEIDTINLPPFRSAIEGGVSSVMSSHAIYPALDPDLPATLSYKILTVLLREKLKFDGLVLSDDLEMGAIKKKWGVAEGALASFEAGSDVLLICEDQDEVLKSIRILREKLMNGDIAYERVLKSLERIRKAKSLYLKDWKEVSLKEVRSYFGL